MRKSSSIFRDADDPFSEHHMTHGIPSPFSSSWIQDLFLFEYLDSFWLLHLDKFSNMPLIFCVRTSMLLIWEGISNVVPTFKKHSLKYSSVESRNESKSNPKMKQRALQSKRKPCQSLFYSEKRTKYEDRFRIWRRKWAKMAKRSWKRRTFFFFKDAPSLGFGLVLGLSCAIRERLTFACITQQQRVFLSSNEKQNPFVEAVNH